MTDKASTVLLVALVLGAGAAGCEGARRAGDTVRAEAVIASKRRVRPRRKLARLPLVGRWVVTREGETLRDVARRSGAPIEDLEELNGLRRGRSLASASRVFVPHFVRPIRRVAGERHHDNRAVENRRAPRRSAGAPNGAPPAPMVWPVKGGVLSSKFGQRAGRPHEGIDIAAARGSAIRAAAAGRVIYCGSGIRGYGNLVIVRHAKRLVTVYAHNRRNLVQRGARVAAGDVIAEVGHSGRASGDHLHFEVRVGESPQDPLRYVRP